MHYVSEVGLVRELDRPFTQTNWGGGVNWWTDHIILFISEVGLVGKLLG